jgi:hypothetical protein
VLGVKPNLFLIQLKSYSELLANTKGRALQFNKQNIFGAISKDHDLSILPTFQYPDLPVILDVQDRG